MSDELTIQPGVNPQIQPKKTSTTPYALGGAAVGAAAGWGASALYKGTPSAKSYEELIKDANEKDVVDLKAKKEALDKAEKELADAGKVVYDGKEKEALDKAIKARDEELARLTETKSGNSKVFQAKNWDKLGIDATDLPTTNERTGKPFTTNKGASTWEKEVRGEYNRLKAEYDKAVHDLNSRLGSGDEQKLIQHKFDIQKYLDDSYNANKKVKPDKLDKLFTTETGWGKHTYEYTRAEKVANTIIPSVGKDPNKLTNAQVQAFAEKLDNGAATPAGYRSRTVFEVVEGKRKPVKYAFSSDMFNEFRNSENAKVAEQRTELIESLLNRAKENIGLQKRQANFVKDFIETVPDSTAEKTGLFKTTKGGRKEVKITNIISEVTSNPSFYDKDLNKVAKAIEKNGGAYTTMPTGLKGSYAGAKDLQQLQEMIQSRKDVLKMFNQEQRALAKDLRACVDDHAVLKQLEEKIADVRNADEGVAKAKEAIFKQFPGLAEGIEKAGLTQSEAMEKESYKKLAKVVEDKQALYDKVAAEKGKVNETAKKAAEEVKNKAKSELDDLVKTLNSKVKGMSGGAKAAVIGGLAVVGGLIGANMAKSKNKNAEAAARQIIA